MKRNRLRPVLLLITLFILTVPCGSANAADTSWDLRAALTRQNELGEPVVNEELLRLAQDVRRTFAGEYLRVTVADALFDGRSLIVAWELENLSAEQPVYLMPYRTDDSADWQAGEMIGGGEEFLRPGQIQNRFMDCQMREPVEGDTMHVGIRYSVLTPTVEPAYFRQPDPMEIANLDNLNPQEQEYIRKMLETEAEKEAQIDEGKFVVDSNSYADYLYMGSAFYKELNKQRELLGGECTEAEAMVATGKFALREELEVAFDLEVTERIVSILPNGEPVEKEYEDFTMRVTHADYTTGTMEIIIEAVFADAESVKKFGEEGRSFVALDEDGLLIRDGGMSTYAQTGRQEERDDGTWVVEYVISHRELFRLPESVTVCPAKLVSDGGSFSADDPMEGVVLTLR